MRRERGLIHRILLAIEALPSGGPHVLNMEEEDQQDVLDHLDLLEQQKLIRATVHRAGGKVDHVAIRGLTPAGHDLLEAEARQAGQPPFMGVSARGMAAGEGPVGPTGSGEPSPSLPPGANGTTGPASIGVLGSTPIVQPPRVTPSEVHGAHAVQFSASDEDRSHRPSSRVVVLLQVDALLLVVRHEIDWLREKRINDDPELRDLEEFEEQIGKLKFTTIEAASGRASPEAAEQAGRSFGSYLRSWFDKHHEEILTDSAKTLNGTFKTGVFLSATAICASLNVEPTLAATISGVLVGGAPVNEAIKAAVEWTKKLKGPPA